MLTTDHSLLGRLRQSKDRRAWERFVALYTPLLVHWGRQLGAAEGDVADLVQEVFVVFVDELPRFQADPERRFRGWLWTVMRNQFVERRRRQPHQTNRDLGALPDRADLTALEEAEEKSYLLRRALELLEGDFQPATWQAFWRTAIDGREAGAVAAELGMNANAVYAARFRVLSWLRQEMSQIFE